MAKAKKQEAPTDYVVGKNYFIRGVTMYYTGRLVRVTEQVFVLEDCAWIADTGRFFEAMKTGVFSEVEPYPDGWPVIIQRGAGCDGVMWPHPLPREAK